MCRPRGSVEPAEEVVLGHNRLGVIGIDGHVARLVGAGLVFEIADFGPLAVDERVIDAVVRTVRHLRDELVGAVGRDVEGHGDARTRTHGVEAQDVLRPEHFFVDGGAAAVRDRVGQVLLDFDLRGVRVWQARGAVRRLRQILRNAVLIPERHAAEQVGPFLESRPHGAVGVVGPSLVLDVERECGLERDRIEEVPSIRRHSGTEARAIRNRHARVRSGGHAQAPCVVEVVLGARALDEGLFVAVDVEEVVAFAEPAGLVLHHAQHRADVVSPAPHVEHVVGRAHRRRHGLLVEGMEIRRVGRQTRHLLPVDVIVEVGNPSPTLVGDRDATRLLEGHGPIAVPRAPARRVADHQRLHLPLETVADAEEVADRSVDAGRWAAVVVHAEAQQSRPPVLIGRHGQPDVRHDARSREVREDDRLTGNRTPAVVVAVEVEVVARRPASREVSQPRQVREVRRNAGRWRRSVLAAQGREQEDRQEDGESTVRAHEGSESSRTLPRRGSDHGGEGEAARPEAARRSRRRRTSGARRRDTPRPGADRPAPRLASPRRS